MRRRRAPRGCGGRVVWRGGGGAVCVRATVGWVGLMRMLMAEEVLRPAALGRGDEAARDAAIMTSEDTHTQPMTIILCPHTLPFLSAAASTDLPPFDISSPTQTQRIRT